MNQFWQYWTGGVDEYLLDAIIERGDTYPAVEAGLGFDGSTPNDQYRSSEIRWIPPGVSENRFIPDLLWYFVRIANRDAFGFHVDHLNDIQYTTYHGSEGGKYDWHSDTFWANPSTYDRKLSVVIQLSEPDEYEGGDFEIDPQHPQPDPVDLRKRGTIIIFPSFLRHRVTPVTSGTRKSLVAWVEGPKFR